MLVEISVTKRVQAGDTKKKLGVRRLWRQTDRYEKASSLDAKPKAIDQDPNRRAHG
jgi:hypothetical protein